MKTRQFNKITKLIADSTLKLKAEFIEKKAKIFTDDEFEIKEDDIYISCFIDAYVDLVLSYGETEVGIPDGYVLPENPIIKINRIEGVSLWINNDEEVEDLTDSQIETLTSMFIKSIEIEKI